MKSKAQASLSKLIEKFERELTADKIKNYNEEATKISFIQPLLKDVLGWEVGNQDEVSPEERISRGRVDYGLKVEGKIKVFVEAKPPRADLNKHIEQAVRYGYNRKGVPFVLLTDFEDLKLFDVTVKPDARNPRKGIKIDLRWNNYLKEFDKLWLLSKESVIKGKLDKLLLVKPKDRLPVDKAILDDLKRWREALAKDIYKHNHEKVTDADELKEINQRILDRIIFMRFCEDRDFIHRRPLKELFEERTETVGLNTMVFLKEEFKHYNLIFDSDLFRPQDWESNLAIDFKIIKDIVLDTYNPYQFDVIPLEVLGNIYEQYLGYTVRLTDHQVKYELKPDVRKAGGVYYTPEYIVDYIVKNTVGKLLQESTPAKIKKLRILDPACGSGSFLIRAYEEMLNYYKQQKTKKRFNHGDSGDIRGKEGKQRKLELKEEVEPRLTIEEKSRILREHIFGVDIDEQAVEVTKLSLMLKMLEGEYGIIPGRAILPMLDKNIRCGNSLISGSPLGLKDLFGEDWYNTKPFDWKTEFRKIMVEEGGFDVVIGNPPYVNIENIPKPLREYFVISYGENKKLGKRYDIYQLFAIKGLSLLKDKGNFGFILPNTFLMGHSYRIMRKFVYNNAVIYECVDLPQGVFKGITVDNVLLFLQRDRNPQHRVGNKVIINKLYPKSDKSRVGSREWDETFTLPQRNLVAENDYKLNIYTNPEQFKLFQKLESISVRLGDISESSQGIILYKTSEDARRAEYTGFIQKKGWKKLLRGRNIGRYIIKWNGEFVNYGPWLWCQRDEKYLKSPKILLQAMRNKALARRLVATHDTEQYYNAHNLANIIAKENSPYDLKYILALMNSELLNFWYKAHFPNVNINPNDFRQLPIRTIDFNRHDDEKFHNTLVALVDVMLDLNKKIQTAKGSQKDQIQRQIEKTDKEIDELVYKLYNITEEERKIVERKY